MTKESWRISENLEAIRKNIDKNPEESYCKNPKILWGKNPKQTKRMANFRKTPKNPVESHKIQ